MSEEADLVTRAKAAIVELRRLVGIGTQGSSEQDLMRLADDASAWLAEGRRREIADQIIGGLTVLRFGGTFGADPEPGRQQVLRILDSVDAALG